MCLPGTQDPSLYFCWHYGSLIYKMSLRGRFKPFFCNDKYFATEHSEKIEEKLQRLASNGSTLWSLF